MTLYDPYIYKAKLLRTVDGDTCDVSLSMGLHEYRETRLRFYGINAPELHDPDPAVRKAAQQAVMFVSQWMELRKATEGYNLLIRTHLDSADKYGRVLGLILGYADVVKGSPVSLNRRLLDAGLAVPFMGEVDL